MTLDELQQAWAVDCVIDEQNPDKASAKSPQLHSKYLNELISFKMKLNKIQLDMLELKNAKTKYFRGEMTREELNERGWVQWQYKTLKSEIESLLDGDSDMQKLYAREAYVKTAIYFLESVIGEIRSRSFHCKNIITWMQFRSGV
jgi:hypothetical protein